MTGATASMPEDASERILAAAFALFADHGLLDVSVEDILAKAHASKSTFYQRFGSKEKVVVAYLEHGLKNLGMLVEAAKVDGGGTSAEALLAVFDFFDEWSKPSVMALSSILRVLRELEPTDPLKESVVAFLDRGRDRLASVAAEAGLDSPAEFARAFQVVTRGALIAAVEGDVGAAARARNMAAKLIAVHTSSAANNPKEGRGSISPRR
ncbi:TetR/AcrR family transcriptional regulator [Sinomonas albida]|uniref:TetR/AcrR family transcriptional regulator n=1 Tax=Sinomonas albida TaxID=369942 RepID=UPI0010A8332E|nr:TetR/AcrR family transcriptional regulator [Sinomonas albida]